MIFVFFVSKLVLHMHGIFAAFKLDPLDDKLFDPLTL